MGQHKRTPQAPWIRIRDFQCSVPLELYNLARQVAEKDPTKTPRSFKEITDFLMEQALGLFITENGPTPKSSAIEVCNEPIYNAGPERCQLPKGHTDNHDECFDPARFGVAPPGAPARGPQGDGAPSATR